MWSCFWGQLYFNPFESHPFDLIENGNILVDTCELKPGVTFDSGSAIFDGTGYIACRMNLSDWIEKLSSSINLTLTQTSVVTQTGVAGMAIVPETFTSTHTYENFTITAAIVPTATVIRKLLPVVYYEPKDSNTAQPALVLISKKIFPLQLSGLGCDEIVMDSDEQVWWYDLRGSIEEEPTAYFQYAHNFFDDPSDPNEYGEYDNPLCRTANVEPLEFSLKEAVLYIGYDPDKEKTFTGTIDAILIDPTDSKPEKQ